MKTGDFSVEFPAEYIRRRLCKKISRWAKMWGSCCPTLVTNLFANIMFDDTVVLVEFHSSTVGDVTLKERRNCCNCNNTYRAHEFHNMAHLMRFDPISAYLVLLASFSTSICLGIIVPVVTASDRSVGDTLEPMLRSGKSSY